LIIDHYNTGRATSLPFPLYDIKRLGYKLALSIGIKKASKLTAISETTKSEIINHYKIDSNNITVTYDALDNHFFQMLNHHKPKNYYKFPYILYIGNAYPHKNLDFLIEAFELLRRIKNIKLVLVGDDSFFYPRLKDLVARRRLENDIIFFGNANDQQLIDLYTFSSLLVFPSLMEGFGLPNLEAVSCGKLCVVSDIPAFKEIWGENLIYFKLNNTNDLINKIIFVLNMNHNEYQRIIEKAKRIIEKYNWQETAIATLKLYQQIYEM
jgi:glycosyltransferase involved in cell wall biosynthesis